jgi:hypothetical protein
MGFRKGRFGDFSGHHDTAAERPPENCLSALARVFSRQRSEDDHGRKKILSTGETP